MKEAKALQEELMEAGAIPMDDDELDGVAGGRERTEVNIIEGSIRLSDWWRF